MKYTHQTVKQHPARLFYHVCYTEKNIGKGHFIDWQCDENVGKGHGVIASCFLLPKGLMLVWMTSNCIKMIYSKWKGNVKLSVGALNVKGFFFSSISNMSALTGIYWLNGHRDHLSKKQQHNHKGVYFMICNEVQILPTTLSNQIKPNFPSLEGQRVYKSRRNWKGLFCFWST